MIILDDPLMTEYNIFSRKINYYVVYNYMNGDQKGRGCVYIKEDEELSGEVIHRMEELLKKKLNKNMVLILNIIPLAK